MPRNKMPRRDDYHERLRRLRRPEPIEDDGDDVALPEPEPKPKLIVLSAAKRRTERDPWHGAGSA